MSGRTDYYVRVAGGETPVSVLGESAAPRVAHEGREEDASLVAVGKGEYVLRVAGRQHRVWIEPDGDAADGRDPASAVRVEVDGVPFEVEVLSDAQRKVRATVRTAAARRGPQVLRAPMPCRIAAVNVQAGDSVASGQKLLVIEAMKMQSELKAGAEGRVREVRVQAGQVVAAGEVLLRLE